MIDAKRCYIRQIKHSLIVGAELVGKWYCSINETGTDGHPVSRYLQLDGTWGKNTQYHESKDDIEALLKNANEPDFNMSAHELDSRDLMRRDTERMFEEQFDD